LFDSINEGFAIGRVVTDDRGCVVDVIFVDVNPAFASHTGLHDVVGKRLSELIPTIDPTWLDAIETTATSDQAISTVMHAKALGNRWLDISAFRLDDADDTLLAATLTDITERKQTEDMLHKSEER